jgi:hypothetical protein
MYLKVPTLRTELTHYDILVYRTLNYHSVQNLLNSRLPSKNIKFKV